VRTDFSYSLNALPCYNTNLNTHIKIFIFYIYMNTLLIYHVKDVEMDRTCSTNGGKEECI
jgi:hypothetical protein